MKGHEKADARMFKTQKNKNIDIVPTLNKKQNLLAGLEHEFVIELLSRAKIAGPIQGNKT